MGKTWIVAGYLMEHWVVLNDDEGVDSLIDTLPFDFLAMWVHISGFPMRVNRFSFE